MKRKRGPWRSQIWDELDRKRLVKEIPARSMFIFVAGGENGVLVSDGTSGRKPMDVTPEKAIRVAMGLLAGWKLDNEI